MEELPSSASSTSPRTTHCDTQQARLTARRPRSPPAELATSEPFLRFPRPQGNRRLAKWISLSNPDIMPGDVMTEDSALSESTYEFITATDSESHDEQYTGSMSESLSSLDFPRPDDAHSLAETEQTHDDGSFIDDDTQSVSQDEPTNVLVEQPEGSQQSSDNFEVEEEARSRCSLEYTQHSLKTPSIMTPEASNILERTLVVDCAREERQAPVTIGWLEFGPNVMSRIWDHLASVTSTAMPGFLFAAAFSLVIAVLYPSPVHFAKVQTSPALTSTITATTTPTAVYTITSTSTPSAIRQTTSAKGMGLTVSDESTSDEWLFASKKPDIQFSPLGHGTIMIHADARLQRAWLKKNCLFIGATRDSEVVQTHYVATEQGFLVEFAKNEIHGVVQLLVRAACRPSVAKAVDVHFGKGIMEEVYEITRNIAHDISGLVPVAAHEAERCLVGAKKSICAVSDTFASSVVTASDNLSSKLRYISRKLHDLLAPPSMVLGKTALKFVDRLSRVLKSAHDLLSARSRNSSFVIKESIQDGLVDVQMLVVTAQISAKMWWLRVTGRQIEHDDYGRKAEGFVATKRVERKLKIRGQSQDHSRESSKRCRGMRNGR